jgi:hypothetical protein
VIVGCQRNTISVRFAADNPSTLKWVRRRITVDAKDVTDYVKFGKEEPCDYIPLHPNRHSDCLPEQCQRPNSHAYCLSDRNC